MDIVSVATSTLSGVETDGQTLLIAVLSIFGSLVVLGLFVRWVRSFIGKRK